MGHAPPGGRPARRSRGAGAVPFGRATSVALPPALAQGVVASTACIGNRVYTGLDEVEWYVAVPGKVLAGVADEVETIAAANGKLFEYHRERRQALVTDWRARREYEYSRSAPGDVVGPHEYRTFPHSARHPQGTRGPLARLLLRARPPGALVTQRLSSELVARGPRVRKRRRIRESGRRELA